MGNEKPISSEKNFEMFLGYFYAFRYTENFYFSPIASFSRYSYKINDTCGVEVTVGK